MKILLDEDECGCYNKRVSEAQINFIWRHSQVVRQRSATPLSPVQIWLAPLLKVLAFCKSFFDLIGNSNEITYYVKNQSNNFKNLVKSMKSTLKI